MRNPRKKKFARKALPTHPNTNIPDSGLSLDGILAEACLMQGIISSVEDTRGMSVEHMVTLLAKDLKVKCTDCGHYPYEPGRGSPIESKADPVVCKHTFLKITYSVNQHGRLSYGLFRFVESDNGASNQLIATFDRERDARWMADLLNGNPNLVMSVDMLKVTSPLAENDAFVYQMKSLAGRILTVIDASISGVQNNAIKTLIRKEFRVQMDRVWKSLFNDGEGSDCNTGEDLAEL